MKTTGGNAELKTRTVGKFLELKDKFDLCDIWRIKHPKTKTFTFRQKHFSGFIQRRLDYISVSHNLQERARYVDILNAVSTDHLPVFCSLLNTTEFPKDPGIWKLNNSLIFDRNFVQEMKCFIHDTMKTLLTKDVFEEQSQWEILKYEIRIFSIRYLKVIANEKRKKQHQLKSKLKILEKSFFCDKNIEEYHKCKADLDKIYNNISEGVKIRSKCQWCEENEKSTKYFLNLEKKHAEKSTIRRLVTDKKDLIKHNDINNEIFSYFKSLFEKTDQFDKLDSNTLPQSITLPSVADDQKVVCDNDLTNKELFDVSKRIPNNKSPGNDGLTKEFYETFWDELKDSFINSIKLAYQKKALSTSQRQAVIKLIERKDRDKTLLKNWRPISLLNVDLKIISKAFSSRLKTVLPSIMSLEQTAYIKKRFIDQSGRLISDNLSVTNNLKIKGYLVTMDIEKAFDLLDHSFLISVLKKIEFGENFID